MFGLNLWVLIGCAVAFAAFTGGIYGKGWFDGSDHQKDLCTVAEAKADGENLNVERQQNETRSITFSDADFIDRLRNSNFGKP